MISGWLTMIINYISAPTSLSSLRYKDLSLHTQFRLAAAIHILRRCAKILFFTILLLFWKTFAMLSMPLPEPRPYPGSASKTKQKNSRINTTRGFYTNRLGQNREGLGPRVGPNQPLCVSQRLSITGPFHGVRHFASFCLSYAERCSDGGKRPWGQNVYSAAAEAAELRCCHASSPWFALSLRFKTWGKMGNVFRSALGRPGWMWFLSFPNVRKSRWENRIRFRFNRLLKECLRCVNLLFIFWNYCDINLQKVFL